MGDHIRNRTTIQSGVRNLEDSMAEDEVVSNQKLILNNQNSILANQKIIIDNQETIKRNQETLDEIVKNQQQILSLLKK
jgi:hypothetical protein